MLYNTREVRERQYRIDMIVLYNTRGVRESHYRLRELREYIVQIKKSLIQELNILVLKALSPQIKIKELNIIITQ